MGSLGRRAASLILSALLFALAGCAGGTDETTFASPTASPSPEPVIAATPAATPVPTTASEIEAEATPTAAPDDGRVTIADGFYYIELTDEIKARITGLSYPADDTGAAVTYDDLRYIRVRYFDFEGNAHDDGELIVNKNVAQDVTEIFYKLYQAQYPFTSIRLVDDFGQPADDTLSMEANNTSGFCYRYVAGSTSLSRHSYGVAIDINPLYNPYIHDGSILPENGAMYADRSLGLPGMIDHDDLCYQLFIQYGWAWGGDWRSEKDYQHFDNKQAY